VYIFRRVALGVAVIIQLLPGQVTAAIKGALKAGAARIEITPDANAIPRPYTEKYFSGKVDQLNEYNIATEVLGRSKTVFNAEEDAIARVETHRLRKRLAAFYQTEGRDHPIQMTPPRRKYVPYSIRKPVGSPLLVSPNLPQAVRI